MSDEDRRLVLLFSTGMTGPPMGGFANMKTVGGDKLKFSILRIIGEAVALPSAATCMNLFRLPEYPSQAVLNEKVLTAIRLGSQGFAFA
jgi:E3 ubiquitin-protein ligase HECTD1